MIHLSGYQYLGTSLDAFFSIFSCILFNLFMHYFLRNLRDRRWPIFKFVQLRNLAKFLYFQFQKHFYNCSCEMDIPHVSIADSQFLLSVSFFNSFADILDKISLSRTAIANANVWLHFSYKPIILYLCSRYTPLFLTECDFLMLH